MSVLLCLTVIPQGFAEETEEAQEISEDTRTLYHLGLMELWQDNYVVTKGDVARIFARMVYPENLQQTGENNYFDVSGNMAASDAIQILTDMGYIKDDRYCNPLLPATGRDVAALFVGGVMGYGKADSDIWQMAVRLGLMQGIGAEANVTAAGLSSVIYSGMETPWLVGWGSDTLKSDENQTLLSAMKLRKKNGVLVASPDGSVGAEQRTDDQAVFLSNGVRTALYVEDETLVYGFLGGEATYYYRYGRDKDILIYADFSKVERMTIYSDDITVVTSSSITYENERGKQKTVSLETDCVVIYNGTPITEADRYRYLQPNIGSIVLVKNESGYCAAYVEDLEVSLISQISYNEEKLLLQATVYGDAKTISLQDYEKAELYKNGRTALDLGDLVAQDVVWIAEGLNQEKIRIYASSENAVWGKMVSRWENRARIGETVYPLAEGVLDYSGYGQLDNGDTATFYFGPEGRIFAFTPDKIVEQNMYGYLLQAAVEHGLSSRITFRFINELGQKRELEAADRVTFYDGTETGSLQTLKCKELLQCGQLFQNGQLIDQLVKYSVNGEGKISRILLAQDLTDPAHSHYADGYIQDTFSKVMANSETNGFYMRFDNHGTGKFENKYIAASNAKVFYIDAGLDMKKAEMASVSAAFKHLWSNARTNNMDVSLYNADQYLQVPMIVCKYQERAVSTRQNPVVVENILQTIDADGNDVYALSGFQDGRGVQYLVDETVDVTGLKRGDVIMVAADTANTIVKYRMLCAIDTTENFVTSISSTSEVSGSGAYWDTDLLIYKGAVYDKNAAGDRIVVNTGLDWDSFRSFALSGTMVVRYDRERDQIALDTLSNLIQSRNMPVQTVMIARQSIGKVLLILE